MTPRSSNRRWLVLTAGLACLLIAGAVAGFALGRRWPLGRVERLRARVLGAPPNGWTELARTDLPRYELMRVVRGTSLFLFSGFHTDNQKTTARVEVLDMVTGHWSRRRDLPQPLTHTAPVLLRDTAWFVGGFEGDHPGPATRRVWRYDLIGDHWSNGPPLPAPRGGGVLLALGDTLHFFGGWLPDRNSDSPDHWTLVVGDSAWHGAAPMPVPRGHLSGAALDGKLYALGGTIGHDPVPIDVSAVHRFDPATGLWAEAPRLPFGVSHAEPSTVVYDGRILVIGGRAREAGRENIDDVLMLDPGLGRWIHLDRTPKPLLGGVAVVLGDTLIAGLGATISADPDNPLLWRTTLRNRWHRADSLPVSLGEVAGGIINGKLYLVGEGSRRTLIYDIASGRWQPPGGVTDRPAAGNHHAAEVVDGKLYLFGGFGRDAEGLVQIYDPATDQWRLGPAMPFAAGSSASALIDGKVYVAGGIVGNSTTGAAAVFDPATLQWSGIAPLPRPRNHAASGTDGKRFYVFGGRGPGNGDGNVVANGFDDVQIYDPATNRWIVSDGSPSAPAPLPQARGGAGRAVWLDGEFWVIGGETATGAGASTSGTYARVDVYDPVRNRWRAGPTLPTPRHGSYPLTDAGMLFVAGGGTQAGGSESNRFEIIWPRRSPPP